MSQIGTNQSGFQETKFTVSKSIISAAIDDRDIKIGHSNFYSIFKNRF